MRKAATRAFGLPARRSAVAVGVTAVVLAASGTAYACTTADAGHTGFTPLTAAQVAAVKAALTNDVAAVRQAKALELAALAAHDKAAALAAAKKEAAAKAKLRADLEVAMAKARAAARARAVARARAATEARAEARSKAHDSEAADFRFSDPGRHHCDGDHHWYGDQDGSRDGWRR